jgi:crotonobetainyl-CoA:carnitine CoA-transferase CaiB-like acyl-CoA transferase
MSTPPGALDGVTVLDFSRAVAGPYCTMLLADYGADVVKLERPGVGDDTRAWGPPFVGGESAYYLGLNRNKRSIAVDLGTDAGSRLTLDLAARADVVIQNFRPGTMERLGLGYATVASVNPRVVYCSISGYGGRGPRADEAGFDVMVTGRAGLMSITGHPDGPPAKIGVAVLDQATGLAAHGAICAALLARERGGQGQHIELSLFGTAIGLLLNAATDYLIGGEVMARWGTSHPSIVPYEGFAARDGYFLIGAANDRLFRRLCGVLGHPEWADDPRFATNPDRVQHRDVLLPAIEAITREREVEDWLSALEAAGVPATPINTVDQALADPQVAALDLVQTVDHPTAGPIRLTAPYVHFAGSAPPIRRPPPRLGEHTTSVLAERLGLDTAAIAGLIADGVVAQAEAAEPSG